MNRFRTKKKAKEASEGIGRSSNDSDAPPLPNLKSSKTFRLGGRKNQEPEPKLQLDLANALPSSDDFRTSLLMNGLSARFSMLREQDDPKSKLGKASDDSVLFPSKRQSRMNDFGFSSYGLSDIAEVSSINGSIRPPFAKSRTDSFEYGTDDDSSYSGSIMNRAKPGEGNNLFGGRQKIYKIPVGASGSTKNLAEGSNTGGMGGRALYENDVSQSAFQKLREREKEQQQQQEEREREEAAQNSQYTRSASPPLAGYNRNRETSSTTSSAGPSITRSSTAATSFTSQRTPSLSGSHTPITPGAPPSASGSTERTTTKGRRLYETGLDQHLNEQQSSAMNRIDTLTRQRTYGAQTPPPGFASPTGHGYPADRWERQQIAGKASMPNMRTTSPSPTLGTKGNFDFGVRTNLVTERIQVFGTAAPLSPPISGDDDHTVLAVQPNDRGKATALGAFAKPVQPYDENQYSQRQIQMQQGREGRDTPPLRKNSPPRAFVPRQRPVGRPRGDSNATFASASARSRSSSSAQRQFLPQERVQENPVSKIAETDNDSSNPGISFLSSPNNSSVGSPNHISNDPEPEHDYQQPLKPIDLYNKYRQEQPSSIARPPESQHPALRDNPFEFQDSGNGDVSPMSTAMPRLRIGDSPTPSIDEPAPIDSPTLGPTTGLSSLIHQHMRTDSNTSSIYGGSTYGGGMPSSGLVSRFPQDTVEPLPQHQYSSKTNPWEHNDWDNQSDDGDNMNNFSLENAVNKKKPGNVVPLPLNPRSPNVEAGQESRKTSWEKEMEAHHTRNGSSETQKEQQDFKMDLAARRRKVQENLKSFVETDSRSVSPALGGSELPKDSQPRNNPLGLLRSKTSRGSIVVRPDKAGQSKAMKMLGIGQSTMNSSPAPGKPGLDDHQWKVEEGEMLRGTKTHVLPTIIPTAPIVAPQTKAFRQARRDAQRDREKQVATRHQQRMALEGAEQDWAKIDQADNQQRQRGPMRDNAPPNIRVRQRSPSHERRSPMVTQNLRRNGAGQERESQEDVRSVQSARPSRDRSSSDASGRSKSRNGRYKDDLAKSMAEGTSSSTRAFPEGLNPPPTHFLPRSPGTPGLPFTPSPIPSPMNGSNVAARNRSNSKTGYFDGHKLQPLQTGDGVDIGLSPRPSPVTPFSANTTPSLLQPSPSASRANTPTIQGLPNDPRVPGARKFSVNKADISEPRFISSTSRVTTVDLAPGVSLQSGSEAPPPIPAVNPRRKTRAMFGFGKKEEFDEYSLPAATQSTDEMSTFSADEGPKPKGKGKLRKISSEGGNMNLRARQAANALPSPAVPAFPTSAGFAAPQVPGGMF